MMSEAEALSRIADVAGFDSPKQVSAFLLMADDEKVEFLQGMQLAGKLPPSRTTWQEVFQILGAVGAVAGVISGVSGAVTAVYGIGKL